MLRTFIIAWGVLYIVVAVLLALFRVSAGCISFYLLLSGLIIVGAIVLERRGYNPNVRRNVGYWEDTGERTVDPATGRVTKVMYNPRTGERDYVDAGPGDAPSRK